METCALCLKPIDPKIYYETGKCFIKVRSYSTMNSPTINNTFLVVVKNFNFN